MPTFTIRGLDEHLRSVTFEIEADNVESARVQARTMCRIVNGVQESPNAVQPTVMKHRYRVRGVHRETHDDIDWIIPADTAANARVKAELLDVVVTTVASDDADACGNDDDVVEQGAAAVRTDVRARSTSFHKSFSIIAVISYTIWALWIGLPKFGVEAVGVVGLLVLGSVCAVWIFRSVVKSSP